jgi:MoaA/NifB/PqqE/SkfB family radical SAM enzyme
MFNIESFCGEVWSQIEINTLGDYKICCLANYSDDYGLALDENGKVMNVMTHSIQEAINSATHKDHRIQLKNNIKVQRCRNCYEKENSTKDSDFQGESKRYRVNFETAKEIREYVTPETADQYTLENGTSTAKVVNLGLRLGNLCNQKCIMCSPEFSNQWYDDWVKIYGYGANVLFSGGGSSRGSSSQPLTENKKYIIEKAQHGKHTINYLKWWETDIWWERFDEIAPDLRHLYFSGGEPLVSSALNEILTRLIEKDFAKNIVLRFDTNLSVINNKIIEKFKHFKKINFCVSIDEVNERYELIRFPGNYNTFIDNVKLLQLNKFPITYLSTCIGIATIYSMIRVTEVTEELAIPAEFRFLEAPFWLDIRSLPKTAKQEIIQVYKSLNHSPIRTRHYNSLIKLLEKYINYENRSRIQEFVITMDKLDNIRNTNWRETLPDVCDILKRHCPESKA